MDVRYLLLLLLLVSCMPASEVAQGNLSADGTTNTDDTANGAIPDTATQWNYLSTLTNSITINASNLNSTYISGKNIELFLGTTGNFSQDYCMVSRYRINNLNHEIRTRVVPISYYDFTAKRTIRIFRVDFNDVANSNSVCGTLPLQVFNSSNIRVADSEVITAKTANPALLCTSCTAVLTSVKLMIFKKSLATLDQLLLSEVDLRSLSLAVDPNNNATNSPPTCSQAECTTRGYDCCLDNQCITDGAIRPSARTQYASQLASAEIEKTTNPMVYISYPHLYYVCGTTVPPTSTTGGSSGGGYTQGLTQLKKDYFCIEHMKKNKTGATFHQDIASSTNFLEDVDVNNDGDTADLVDIIKDRPGLTDQASVPATLYPADIECRNGNAPASEMNYKKVVERLYKNCGCAKTSLNDMVTFCPAYEYSVNYMENGLPNRIDCYTPPNITPPVIPSQRTISLNSRSAPHRFFRTCGDESGSSTACATGDNQEGDFFEYQDSGNVLPSQETFGMNSILGPMSVTLDKALPAKTVAVELDQVYQISTTSGFYTPCPTCGKDSWFTSLSAYPTSSYGAGLQAVGHSTSRDLFDFNTTGGNYEDTIFGRACWIPPTMLPFTHQAYAPLPGETTILTTQRQRLARLKAQAALYANGYQRDWFGFNKGALIGSFDGVTWFAVGKGRIVRSTSTKLFLAINAPFADLASPTLHVVNVQAYDGITQAAQVDYDPSLHLNHSNQNEAGNCQASHLCATDTDCVTRLGWEYMCADVQGLTTQWPKFNTDAVETPNTLLLTTIDQVLQQKRFPSASTKRCVYRGSGSVCMPNSTVVTDLNKRKNLTCAPNFYCANVNSASVFNSKVSRYASSLENIPVTNNHYFGKDANVLGRPLSYIASSLTTSLPSSVRQALAENVASYDALAATSTGVCLPGKALPEATNQATLRSPYEQHRSADSTRRTDYISQIGSCNSGLFTANRYASCPVMGSDGNYEFLSATYSLTGYSARATAQNSCGLDTLLMGSVLGSGAEALSSSSPFRGIEAKTLSTQTVVSPTLARDACLRRAGSVCHTDLDCGPNKMHAEQTVNFSLAYFGNEAERSYYSEFLVCGQGSAKPSPQDSVAFKAFEMKNNRCCREIGSDLTTYTSYIPTKVSPIESSNLNASTIDDNYLTNSYGLAMSVAPGIAPQSKYRYSRLATVENLGTADRPYLNAYQDRVAGVLGTAQSANVMTPYQWKTLGEANSESCCGGGWIRKFSDGTTDWSRRDRVYIDVKNFACLNSRSVLLTNPADVASQYGGSAADVVTLVNQDEGDYCKSASDPSKGFCAQYSFQDTVNEVPPTINPMTPVAALPADIGHWKSWDMLFTTWKDFYFHPRSADANKNTFIDNADPLGRRNISIKIPSYITRASLDIPEALMLAGTLGTTVQIKLVNMDDDSESIICEKHAATFALSSATTDDSSGAFCPSTSNNQCCFSYDSATRILKVIPDTGSIFSVASGPSKKIVAQIVNAAPAGTGLASIVRTKPGTNSYYLKRLGRLELTGIPQISYQPLTCNDNSDRILPGIFNYPVAPDMRVSHFNLDAFSFPATYTDPDTNLPVTSRYTNRFGLAHEAVFSENDFKCCTPLGKTTKDKNKCCSGTGKPNAAGTSFTCSLPEGADLMVYFNRFVSNEGRLSTEPGGGLVDADFNLITGEPKLTNAVTAKISALGTAYCTSGKVRMGGAFGAFKLEPSGNETNQNETIYGIVDSSNDSSSVSTSGGSVPVGYTAFMSGFRWNHHLYCDEDP